MTSYMLAYGDQRIPYQVSFDDHRSTRIAIHVNPDGSVYVDAPHGFDDASIQSAVQKRARWVASHVTEAHKRYAHVRPKEYVSGEQILYLGRRYMLKVLPVTDKPVAVSLVGNRLEVQTKSGNVEDVKGRVRAWYRVKGRDYLLRRLLFCQRPCHGWRRYRHFGYWKCRGNGAVVLPRGKSFSTRIWSRHHAIASIMY